MDIFKILCAITLVFALAIPATAGVELGVDAEFMLNKDVVVSALGEKVDMELSGQFVDVNTVVVLGELVTLKPSIGINTLQLDGTGNLSGLEINSDLGYSLGIGAEVALAKTNYADLSLIGDYRYIRSSIDEASIDSFVLKNPIRNTIDIHKYEVGIKAEKNLAEVLPNLGFTALTPYIGVVYSDLQGKMRTKGLTTFIPAELKADIEAEKNVGIRAGIKCTPQENLELAINAKFIDETSVGASATYKF